MKSKYDYPKMNDSFLIPAPTIRIPMPPGAGVPRQEETHEGVIASLAGSESPSPTVAGG